MTLDGEFVANDAPHGVDEFGFGHVYDQPRHAFAFLRGAVATR